jgi:hypothetical protein
MRASDLRLTDSTLRAPHAKHTLGTLSSALAVTVTAARDVAILDGEFLREAVRARLFDGGAAGHPGLPCGKRGEEGEHPESDCIGRRGWELAGA